MDRAQENAVRLADWLKRQEGIVAKVIYPGLPEHPGYELQKKQARGFGAMLTFDVDSEERVEKILNRIELIQYAESLGGTETLLTYPITQTHADVPREELAKNGITERTLRMSVGIENIKDLIDDLEQALRSEDE
jgi:cystathionine beta-lyase/cystathionine gamma-synthase